jgi:hypothetical protein
MFCSLVKVLIFSWLGLQPGKQKQEFHAEYVTDGEKFGDERPENQGEGRVV